MGVLRAALLASLMGIVSSNTGQAGGENLGSVMGMDGHRVPKFRITESVAQVPREWGTTFVRGSSLFVNLSIGGVENTPEMMELPKRWVEHPKRKNRFSKNNHFSEGEGAPSAPDPPSLARKRSPSSPSPTTAPPPALSSGKHARVAFAVPPTLGAALGWLRPVGVGTCARRPPAFGGVGRGLRGVGMVEEGKVGEDGEWVGKGGEMAGFVPEGEEAPKKGFGKGAEVEVGAGGKKMSGLKKAMQENPGKYPEVRKP
ncbi:hypothetical protein T484DRAFT_1829220 [Baffinella frigidus]|nr:hypothetical protein T484DRAFT_1829220 [Cryptophyta sp. CCMP2293]